MTPWSCARCGEDQIAFGPLPADRLCHTCNDALHAARAFTEADAGTPQRYRGFTRESWSRCFQRPWPAALEAWAGEPHWLAIWGPTGTGKTGLATILLAEHLRTGQRGRWISGPELAHRIRLDFTNADEAIRPLLVTPLLVLDEPILGAWDWYMERLTLITRTRDERGLPTIVTAQLLPELLLTSSMEAPPPLLSRWLSGLQLQVTGDDVRLMPRKESR
jgi:hypothetical protein